MERLIWFEEVKVNGWMMNKKYISDTILIQRGDSGFQVPGSGFD